MGGGRRTTRMELGGRNVWGIRGGSDAWWRAVRRAEALADGGRLEEAAECYGEAASLAGDGSADPHALVGDALLDMGRPEEALAHFDRAVKADPGHTIALFRKAEALLALNRVDEARGWCGRAIESDPGDAMPHHTMGNILMRLGCHEAAIAEYAEAVRIDPGSFRSYANMGTAHIKEGRPAEALRCLESALRIDPGYAYAHCQRSVALSGLGREDEARKSWEKATRYDPRFMLGDARVHLRADRQAELSRAGWREGRPPRGLGRIRLPKGGSRARSKKGRERDITMAKVRAACELEGISMFDAVSVAILDSGVPRREASIADRVREMRGREEEERRSRQAKEGRRPGRARKGGKEAGRGAARRHK